MKFLVSILCFVLAAQPLLAAERVPFGDDPYEILGVNPTDPDERVTEAWKELVKTHHPDAGGSTEEAQDINEAYQFLKGNRVDYDRRILPFRGVYKRRETRPVPYTYEETLRFQVLFLRYIRAENRAREALGPFAPGRPVLVLYATLKQAGESGYFRGTPSWQLHAYSELLRHIDLLTLSKLELKGIFRNDPAHALEDLLLNFDNFNVRGSTVAQLFEAHERLFLTDEEGSTAFLGLIERMRSNRSLFERRYASARGMFVRSLKGWLRFYFAADKNFRLEHAGQYARTRSLVLALEPLPSAARTCVQLLLGRVD